MKKEDLIKIYSLDFHESFEFKCGASSFFITRVAGGWLYENYRLDCNQLTTTFVPFNNEFQHLS